MNTRPPVDKQAKPGVKKQATPDVFKRGLPRPLPDKGKPVAK